MIDLTARQVQILRAIIEDFIETAQPVGSETVDRKFQIGVSPATIRNEMVYLTKQGYLNKTHSSAGRVPTPLAMKLYVNELMKERELTVADEVSAKEKIWNSRNEVDQLMHELSHVLAEKSHALGLAVVNGKRIYSAGYANLLHMPEFYDIQVTRHVLQLVEEAQLLQEIFEYGANENIIQVVYGQELGNRYLEPIGVVFTTLNVGGQSCRVAAIGSMRFDYSYFIPTLKYLRALVSEIVE